MGNEKIINNPDDFDTDYGHIMSNSVRVSCYINRECHEVIRMKTSMLYR